MPLRGEKGGALSAYFQDYVSVAAFVGLGVILVLVFLGIAAVLRPANPHAAKLLTYECGVDPVGEDWSQSQVRYYIYALLFVVFDVEAVFIFPWALILEKLGVFGLVEMLVFIAVLMVGLVYAIRKGVLKWV
ncbi:NAD(P)H-quinone oxidoreductase subunit 3 [bacterium BMS3Abin02]|nr:NAD(P)H-quinone oxidoreductase subunit 3 [bacterium BMS3Abin02]HDH26960.1 NADH-quinone oxidoreductase subunit A [Actinomycetota bacterium]HDK44867.1 NADH-quinone oxidoreductase subunit A [Actinomycetota bacterium]